MFNGGEEGGGCLLGSGSQRIPSRPLGLPSLDMGQGASVQIMLKAYLRMLGLCRGGCWETVRRLTPEEKSVAWQFEHKLVFSVFFSWPDKVKVSRGSIQEKPEVTYRCCSKNHSTLPKSILETFSYLFWFFKPKLELENVVETKTKLIIIVNGQTVTYRASITFLGY